MSNLCPNMINFHALGFSDCDFEEVISFFLHLVSVENKSSVMYRYESN